MKKNLLCIIILIPLILSACNLPTGSESPTPDTIGTMVALTLTSPSLPALETTAGTVTTLTSTGELTLTSQPTGTATVTPTVTETPSETATITITPTQTQNPNDPKANLGEPTWKSTLDSPNSFGLQTPYEDDNSRIAIANGAMTLTSYSTIGYYTWRLTSPTPKNFYLEATFKTLNCTGGDQYGLVFRAPDYSSGYGYYFTLTCDGRYNLIKWDDTGLNALMGWGSDPVILAGPNNTNILGVLTSNSSIKLFINQKLLIELADTKFTSGHFGAFVAGYSGSLTASMEDIAYWNLP
jgi:hypothetical protein